MTPVPRRVQRQIADIVREAARLESIIGIPYAVYADRVRLGYPNGGSGRGGSDVSDPTAGAALDPVNGFKPEERPATRGRPGKPAVSDQLSDIELLENRIANMHRCITGITDRIDRERRLAPELALAAWIVERCEVPNCVTNAVRKGKCWPHYKASLDARTVEAS